MDRHVAEAVRQQSDDLRDELKELEQWEAEVSKAAEAAKLRRTPARAAVPSVAEIPVRGTVASIKQAIATRTAGSAANVSSSATPSEAATQKDRGNEFFRKGQVADAIRCYTRGIELDAGGSVAHVLYANRAMCHLKLQAWPEAEADATESVKLCRGYAKAYYRRAIARKNLGRLREARADLESVLALSAGDAAALAEMEAVTHLLQTERARATAQTAKKRVVIEEVDEEEDAEEDGTAGRARLPAAASPAVDGEAAQRLTRIDAHVKEVEEVRSREAAMGRTEALRKEQEMRARLRTSARVEVVDEDNVAGAVPSPSPTAAAEECAVQFSHASQESTSSAQATARAPQSTGSMPSRKTTTFIHPTQSLPTKETLRPAATFTEFERQFAELQGDESLRDHYLGLLNPATMRAMFGNNLTPDILVALLGTIRQLDAPAAVQFLKGVVSINRVSDLALFFTPAEREVAKEAVMHVQGGDICAKDVEQIRAKLHL